MTPKLASQLISKYPKIFNTEVMSSTNQFVFDIEDGWYNILDRLCHMIQWYIDSHEALSKNNQEFNQIAIAIQNNDMVQFNEKYASYSSELKEKVFNEMLSGNLRDEKTIPQIVALQVKEKFGTLRFYYKGGDQYIKGLVDMAEAMSAYTCEICGNKANIINKKNYLKSLCKDHDK